MLNPLSPHLKSVLLFRYHSKNRKHHYIFVNTLKSNQEQLGHNKYRKCTCQAYCGEEGKFISSIRRYNQHARKRKRDELILCKEDGQSIQHHREESINNDTNAEIPQIDPTEDDFFYDSGQDTETS